MRFLARRSRTVRGDFRTASVPNALCSRVEMKAPAGRRRVLPKHRPGDVAVSFNRLSENASQTSPALKHQLPQRPPAFHLTNELFPIAG